MGHAETHRLMHAAFNNRDYDAITARLAPGFLLEDLPRGLTVKSAAELVTWLRGWTTAFSDATVGSATYDEGVDHCTASFHARGHQDGPLRGVPATGQAIDVPFCEVLHFAADGSVLSAEVHYDQVTMLTQLGMLPHLGSPTGPSVAPALEAEVRAIFDDFDRLDLGALQERLDPHGQGVDEIARRWLRDEATITDYFRQMEHVVTDIHSELSDVHVETWGDTGVVTCWLEQDYRLFGEQRHVSAPTTVVLRRSDDRWRAALIHSVPMPPET